MNPGLRLGFENFAQRAVDYWFMAMPRHSPSIAALENCKLVSHRGEHDNLRVLENTIAAFEPIARAGVWGIELDLRWTRDLQPVVIHDANTRRVFGVDLEVAYTGLDELRRLVPRVPTLAQVVETFGSNTHLMVELKADELGCNDSKAERLAEIFSTLQAVRDFHFLALSDDLLEQVEFAGPEASLLVAEYQLAGFSDKVLRAGLGGLCGHYLLLNQQLLRRHHARGQKLGTGFAASRFAFYRELNRGVDWIFTNRALELGAIRERLLHRG